MRTFLISFSATMSGGVGAPGVGRTFIDFPDGVKITKDVIKGWEDLIKGTRSDIISVSVLTFTELES